MPEGEPSDNAVSASASGSNDERSNVEIAATRLAQEAKHALSFGSRGIKDITEQFVAASKELQPGQLVKDDYFTLFEAVGALEIMDPKMDSGVILPGEPLDPTFDPAAPLKFAQVIWIMDQLSCLESAWLEGYPLSQTVYTSLHIDRLLAPENRYPYTLLYGDVSHEESTEAKLTHVVLRAYCVAVVKCAAVVMQIIQSQNFYEEEDFVTHLFGRDLLPRLSEHEASEMLDSALSWLETSQLSVDVKDALSLRLTVRQSYMQSVFGEQNEWEDLIKSASLLSKSHSLAEPVPESFTDKVHRHLATSTPPRPMLEVSWEASQARWTKLYADVVEAARLTSFWIRQSPACLQRATWSFASRTPSTYARAVFQDLLFADGRVAADVPHFDLLLTDIRDLVLAGDSLGDPDSFQVELTSDPRHRCSRIFEGFMDKAFDEYLNLYRMVCQNRCRIRRTFTQAIPLLDELESSVATKADHEINAIISRKRMDTPLGKKILLNPLTTWTRYYKLKIMADTVHLGFETDIYLDYEMGQMYWYLSLLTTERKHTIEHIEIFLKDRLVQASKSKESRARAECVAAQDWISILKAEADCSIGLANALSILHNLLLYLHLIRPAARQYATPSLVYDARMKPYLCVASPRAPEAGTFEQAQQLSTSPTAALAGVEKNIKFAKASLATLKAAQPVQGKYVGAEDRWKAEIKQLETACVATLVSITLLKRTLEKVGTEQMEKSMEVTLPESGKRYHPWWVVPQLREKQA